MSKKNIGVTVNGIEEECRWDKTGSCPRHIVHRGVITSASSQTVDIPNEETISNVMTIFDTAYDENLELTDKGFTIDDEETLKDLGTPSAIHIEVTPVNNQVIVRLFDRTGMEIINTGYTVDELDGYMSLDTLKDILDQR